MKTFVLAAAVTVALGQTALAGSYGEPKIAAPVVVADTTDSSAGAALPLLMALMTLAVAVGN
jgi:hypothetical protein